MLAPDDLNIAVVVALAVANDPALVGYVAAFLARRQPGCFVVTPEEAIDVADALADAYLVGEDGRLLRALGSNEEAGGDPGALADTAGRLLAAAGGG